MTAFATKRGMAVLCIALCAGRIAADCGTKKYSGKQAISLDFDNVRVNKLRDFYIKSGGGYEEPTVVMHADFKLGPAKEYINILSDDQKNQLQLDVAGDDKKDQPCYELWIPSGYEINEVSLEGSAQVALGDFTFTDFAVMVANGKLTSRDFLEAEMLDLTVKGSGAIDLQPKDGSVAQVVGLISGGGNITYLGVAQSVEMSTVGSGFATFGEVTDAMDVNLAGSGNTTVMGSEGLVVTGMAQPPNFIHVIKGACNVTSEDVNFKPCAPRAPLDVSG